MPGACSNGPSACAATSVVVVEVHVGHVADIDPMTLYRILQLRSAVFVVEQNCAFADLDGRDLEQGVRQVWVSRNDQVPATLRVLPDPAGWRIGRVVTARGARSDGLGALLLERALALTEGADVVLDAQAYLEPWYERFGFARCGKPYLEDGIEHVPMLRRAAQPP